VVKIAEGGAEGEEVIEEVLMVHDLDLSDEIRKNLQKLISNRSSSLRAFL